MRDYSIRVIEAEYICDYKLRIKFSNNEERIVDMEPRLWGEMFEPLKDMSVFKNFRIEDSTIVWPNGADFAPYGLYEIGMPTA